MSLSKWQGPLNLFVSEILNWINEKFILIDTFIKIMNQTERTSR